jgi:hypothetical protein
MKSCPSASFFLQRVKAPHEARRCGSTYWLQKLLGLSGPIKPDMWSVHNSRLVIRAKMVWSLIDTDEGYHTETSE